MANNVHILESPHYREIHLFKDCESLIHKRIMKAREKHSLHGETGSEARNGLNEACNNARLQSNPREL